MRTSNGYVQLDPAVIEQARQMDLLSYLQGHSRPYQESENRIPLNQAPT